MKKFILFATVALGLGMVSCGSKNAETEQSDVVVAEETLDSTTTDATVVDSPAVCAEEAVAPTTEN